MSQLNVSFYVKSGTKYSDFRIRITLELILAFANWSKSRILVLLLID